ncbi:MAG: hypothetical protein CBC83_02385 [Flavobacteriales bacterium TMED123]|nr:hypothetical protein [Candidatus Neomarinimicrobiota bacterium]MAJ44530.1 hypothetical protein [Candidatus Neomarinimicrobiota bacterium]OUV73966.1 MAG: hypothetical protein CBC83_04830 [Flavobacteriales bacterium TMED123]OUV75607.1 MAG: hypothetical protein CBC83_02385 [Flavobacteriales bacterium TMED123]|tara:strand:+ start:228 stop:1094 length:867 start_codon:yes stop_codon:yes gene_type:complete
MEPEVLENQEPTKKSIIKRKSKIHERIEKDEKELKQMLEEAQESTQPQEDKEVEPEPENAEEKSYKKRYADLRRGSQKAKADLEQRIIALESQLKETAAKKIKLPKSDEDIDAWAKEHPEIAAIIETIAIKNAREQQAGLQERVKEIDLMRETASREKAEIELLRLHPDFSEIRDSDDFHDWAEEQPKWVQEALYENEEDARSAARAIDLYKVDRNIKSKKLPTEKDAAKTVSNKSSRNSPDSSSNNNKFSESKVNKMSANEYEKYQDSIMEAIRTGNFIYDLSGSAR